MVEDKYQDKLRGDGTIPSLHIVADNLAEATYKTILGVHDYGLRVETPKQREGMTLGYDADVTVTVKNPDSQPMICFPGIHDDARGLMQYMLEVTHGIHNHWKKTPEEPHLWGYTYHERIIDQMPFVFQRIKADFDEKKGQWGEGVGRPSGRDYQFTTWRPGEDIILEQEDPPCWQSGRIRFARDKDGEIVMNYMTEWRSRDLLKAWNENNLGQIALMKNIRDKTQDMLGIPIKLGSYTDRSSSLHLYGLYVDRDGLEGQVENMRGYKDNKELFSKFNDVIKDRNIGLLNKLNVGLGVFLKDPIYSEVAKEIVAQTQIEKMSMSLEDYLGDANELKRIVAAQSAYEAVSGRKNQPENVLKEAGFDPATTEYPKEWDSWDPRFDVEPDKSKLSRVL